jgi:hypothetical protein
MRSAGTVLDEQGKLNNFAIEPKIYIQENPRIGFTAYAESLNGRLAMIGLFSLLALEAITGHGIIGFLTSL